MQIHSYMVERDTILQWSHLLMKTMIHQTHALQGFFHLSNSPQHAFQLRGSFRRHVECRCQSITQLSLCYSSHRDLSYEKLDEMFTASFILADMKKCVYIVNVDAISNCLYVFRNYGEDGMQYYCALPYRRWGNYFRHKI